MNRETLIKLIEDITMVEIKDAEITYITKKGYGKQYYSEEKDEVETIKINKG